MTSHSLSRTAGTSARLYSHPGSPTAGLEAALTVRAAAYLRAAHGLEGEGAMASAALAARRAMASTPHWRLERAGLAVIEEAARLAETQGAARPSPSPALPALPEAAVRAMPEQNLCRLGLGDLRGGTRRARRRLRVRLRALGARPMLFALVVAALVVPTGSTL